MDLEKIKESVATALIIAALLAVPWIWTDTIANTKKNAEQEVQIKELLQLARETHGDVKYLRGVEDGRQQQK